MSDDGPRTGLAAIEPLLADPAGAAVLSDLDGTLAPIVARPELARVPDAGTSGAGADRRPLRRRRGRQRPPGDRGPRDRRAREADLHRQPRLRAAARRTRPSRGPRRSSARTAAMPPVSPAGFDAAELDAAGLRVEDKGPIVALHWRGAADESGAEALAERIAAEAEGAGLVTHRGRKVLELRPPVARSTRARRSSRCSLGSAATAALYAGDDRTDLDAFSALDRLAASGRLRTAVRIGVRIGGGPGGDRRPGRPHGRRPGRPRARPRGARGLMQFKDLLRGTVLLVAIEATGLAAISAVTINATGDDTLAALALGWWLVAIAVGVWLGRPSRTAEVLRGPLAAAKTVDPAARRDAGPDRPRPALADRAVRDPRRRRRADPAAGARRSPPASRSASPRPGATAKRP